jgi:hypothetical protein
LGVGGVARSSRRSVLRTIAAGSIVPIAGCTSLGLGKPPLVDISVLNATPNRVTFDIEVFDAAQSDAEVLYENAFELEPYQPGTRTRGSNGDEQDAFRASEAYVECEVAGRQRSFGFEAACVGTDEIDEGFSLLLSETRYSEPELEFSQSYCGGKP